MSVDIVDPSELPDADRHQFSRLRRSDGFLHLLLKPVPVQQRGQHIKQGQLRDLFFALKLIGLIMTGQIKCRSVAVFRRNMNDVDEHVPNVLLENHLATDGLAVPVDCPVEGPADTV